MNVTVREFLGEEWTAWRVDVRMELRLAQMERYVAARICRKIAVAEREAAVAAAAAAGVSIDLPALYREWLAAPRAAADGEARA